MGVDWEHITLAQFAWFLWAKFFDSSDVLICLVKSTFVGTVPPEPPASLQAFRCCEERGAPPTMAQWSNGTAAVDTLEGDFGLGPFARAWNSKGWPAYVVPADEETTFPAFTPPTDVNLSEPLLVVHTTPGIDFPKEAGLNNHYHGAPWCDPDGGTYGSHDYSMEHGWDVPGDDPRQAAYELVWPLDPEACAPPGCALVVAIHGGSEYGHCPRMVNRPHSPMRYAEWPNCRAVVLLLTSPHPNLQVRRMAKLPCQAGGRNAAAAIPRGGRVRPRRRRAGVD